jgi:hypothetical protein
MRQLLWHRSGQLESDGEGEHELKQRVVDFVQLEGDPVDHRPRVELICESMATVFPGCLQEQTDKPGQPTRQLGHPVHELRRGGATQSRCRLGCDRPARKRRCFVNARGARIYSR